MQFAPSQNLSKYIKHYLLLDINSEGCKNFRYFTNCQSSLVFVLSDNHVSLMETGTTLSKSFIHQQNIDNQAFGINGKTKVIIVLFQPYGLYGLTGIPANTYLNEFHNPGDIFGKEIDQLHEYLYYNQNLKDLVPHLNLFFSNRLKKNSYETNPLLIDSLRFIDAKRGGLSVHQLCSETGSSERKIQRTFAKHIGRSPKKYINTIKLHYFLKLLRKDGTSTLTSLAYEAGYYDQAHLIKDFKKTVGLVPSKYLKTKRLAVNLLQY